jgi:hypothetical protein
VDIFENNVLRRIFGHKKEEITGAWRKLHSEELHYTHSEELHDIHIEEPYDMHSSPNVTCVFRELQLGDSSDTHGGGEKSICGCGEKI